jgi:hypothetical protein
MVTENILKIEALKILAKEILGMEAQPTRPKYVPPGIDFAALSPDHQRAIIEIIDPLYQEVVAQACNAMEKSAGLRGREKITSTTCSWPYEGVLR